MAMPLSKQNRQDLLARLIFERGTVRVEELQDALDVSAMTLYRDLAELESRHVITRSRGEVAAAASSLSETSFEFRLSQELGVKNKLAEVASQFVSRGNSVFVDDSTSAHFALEKVMAGGPLTVLTNCLGTSDLVSTNAEAELIMIGGRLHRRLNAFYGPSAQTALQAVQVDVALVGAAAVHEGLTHHPYEDVATFKRQITRHANLSVLIVSRSKFERTALYAVTPLADFDVIVTDMDLDNPHLQAAAEAGVRVLGP